MVPGHLHLLHIEDVLGSKGLVRQTVEEKDSHPCEQVRRGSAGPGSFTKKGRTYLWPTESLFGLVEWASAQKCSCCEGGVERALQCQKSEYGHFGLEGERDDSDQHTWVYLCGRETAQIEAKP